MNDFICVCVSDGTELFIACLPITIKLHPQYPIQGQTCRFRLFFMIAYLQQAQW